MIEEEGSRESGIRRQEAGGRRQEAGGRTTDHGKKISKKTRGVAVIDC
jgi:hypothetical protein